MGGALAINKQKCRQDSAATGPAVANEEHERWFVYRKHNFYRNTRCTSVAQEEQSALPAGVININEDSDDDEAYGGEQKEIAKEIDELRAAQHWINQEGWDVASEVRTISKSTGKVVDLRLDWGGVKEKLTEGLGETGESDTGQVDEATVLSDYSLDKLDPTQRVFADRVLGWVTAVAGVYEAVRRDGERRPIPKIKLFLGGSAGSGKSTTLKTCVQHARRLFMKMKKTAKVELTAYTGVAAYVVRYSIDAISSLVVASDGAYVEYDVNCDRERTPRA